MPLTHIPLPSCQGPRLQLLGHAGTLPARGSHVSPRPVLGPTPPLQACRQCSGDRPFTCRRAGPGAGPTVSATAAAASCSRRSHADSESDADGQRHTVTVHWHCQAGSARRLRRGGPAPAPRPPSRPGKDRRRLGPHGGQTSTLTQLTPPHLPLPPNSLPPPTPRAPLSFHSTSSRS